MAFMGSGLGAEKVFHRRPPCPRISLVTVDYHDRACVIRWLDHSTGHDQVFTEVPTTKEALNGSSMRPAWRRAARDASSGSRRAPPAGLA